MPRTHYTKREKDIKREKSRKRKIQWDKMSSGDRAKEFLRGASFLANPVGTLIGEGVKTGYQRLTSRAPATGSSSTSTSTSGTTKKKGGKDTDEEKENIVASKKGGTIRKKKYVTQSKRYSNGGKVYPK